MLNFFDESEITPVALQVESNDAAQITSQLFRLLGESRNYGKSPEQIFEELRDAEVKRVLSMTNPEVTLEASASEERKKREFDESQRQQKNNAEWVLHLPKILANET